jgi:hypothetical protein
VIYTLADRNSIEKVIERVNNPYWLMKELYTAVRMDVTC